jgi:hypothetical protein
MNQIFKILSMNQLDNNGSNDSHNTNDIVKEDIPIDSEYYMINKYNIEEINHRKEIVEYPHMEIYSST